MERRHSDDDWRELGEHLWRAHLELLQSYAKASEMWGNKENVPWEIREVHGAVGRLRVKLDAEYHREKRNVPLGFPIPSSVRITGCTLARSRRSEWFSRE